MSKRILVVTNVYPPNFIGGAELVAHRHACVMRDAGHRVIVFTGEARPGTIRHTVAHDSYQGIPVHRVQLKAEDYNSEYVSFYHSEVERHFSELLRQYSPDVVHFHNLNGLSTGVISQAADFGALTVLTVHDYWGFCFRNTRLLRDGSICKDHTACADCQMYIQDGCGAMMPTRMRKDYLALQFQMLDRVICPSAYLAEAYIESGLVPVWKTAVIHNGADVRRLQGISRQPGNGRVRFGYIGHLGPHKGVSVLLQAFALVCRAGRNAALSVVGQGEQREELQRLAVRLGIADRTRFTGRVDNREIDRIYRDIDVLVIPSVWHENQPVTIMEAMAAGTTVIASRIGGIPEFVEDRKSGLLFEPGNMADLAARMQELMDSPESRAAYAERASYKIQDETYERQAARVMGLYDEGPVKKYTKTTAEKNPVVIICIGARLEWQCADAIDRITRAGAHGNWRFVMSNWWRDFSGAAVAWVTDSSADPESVLPALAARIPLLVPECHTALRKLCVTSHCGLFYQSPDDIEAALEMLTSDRVLGTALGDGGVKHSLQPR